MSVNSKMTALADEVRELSGTTVAKSIDAMTTDIGAANTEIAEQTSLLAQIATALEGKASGSSTNNIEYEIIEIPMDSFTANYTLSRVTKAVGVANFEATITYSVPGSITGINDNDILLVYAADETSIEGDEGTVYYENGSIRMVLGPDAKNESGITLLLINDPSADAISS